MSNSLHKHISLSREDPNPGPMSSKQKQPAAMSPEIRLKKQIEMEKNGDEKNLVKKRVGK